MDGLPTRLNRALFAAMSGTTWVRPLFGERGRGLLCIIWLTVSSLMGPKMNARQQRHGKQRKGAQNTKAGAIENGSLFKRRTSKSRLFQTTLQQQITMRINILLAMKPISTLMFNN